MIVVAGTAKIRPEAREHAVEAARAMVAATRKEAGCVNYRFSFDVEDPNSVHIFEEWESTNALATHFGTPHMATFQKQLGQILAGPPSIQRYLVESVTSM